MAEELAAPPAPAGDAPLPSMQMYATWREKRVQRFSSGVERMRSRLKELQLGGNRIACTGALALARALPRCPMLHILGLSGNVIADSGARAIASVLPSCKQLRKLMMKMNAFRETE